MFNAHQNPILYKFAFISEIFSLTKDMINNNDFSKRFANCFEKSRYLISLASVKSLNNVIKDANLSSIQF